MNNHTGRRSRMLAGLPLFVIMICVCMSRPSDASTGADYYNHGNYVTDGPYYYNSGDYISLDYLYTIKVDLNGDGKEESIQIGRKDNKCKLYVNGKCQVKFFCQVTYARYVSGNTLYNGDLGPFLKETYTGRSDVRIIDLNVRDKQKEILIGNAKGVMIFRYNGKKLIKYAQGKTPLYFTNIANKKVFYYYNKHHIRGDGKIEFMGEIHSQKNKMAFWFVYKVKKGKLILDKGAEHYSERDTRKKRRTEGCNGCYYLTGDGKLAATSDMSVYNTNNYRSSGFKKLFTINTGEKYKILKLKIGNKYSSMYISSGKRKGWTFIDTANLMM